jgi:hypothetical protein
MKPAMAALALACAGKTENGKLVFDLPSKPVAVAAVE